jgi:hypothetical protein
MRRFRLVRAVPVEHQAEAVLGIDGKAMDEVRGMARAQPSLVIVEEIFGQRGRAARIVDADRGGVMHSGGFHPFRSEKGCSHGVLRGIDVILQQARTEIQRVADIVETVGGGVRRKVVRRTNVDTEKVADGVVVFGAIEPVGGDAPWFRLDRAILPRELRLQPMRDCSDSFGRRPRQTWGRHLPELEFFDDLFPDLAIVSECSCCAQCRKIHIAGFDCGAVAPNAALLNEREHIGRFCRVQRHKNCSRDGRDGKNSKFGAHWKPDSSESRVLTLCYHLQEPYNRGPTGFAEVDAAAPRRVDNRL